MAHLHSVYDGDTHFKIIPVSRKIENTTGKVILMQNDHNSERFTFEIPRYIEGHDMSICNKVEVHYNNTDTKTKDVNKDVYEATDLQVSPNSEDVVICSWLISGNATKYAGSLYFVLRFACLTDSTIDYQWFTDIYKDITISKSIFNTETVAIDNSDILEQWKAEIEALFNSGGSGSGGGVAESVVNEKIATAKRELIGGADDLTDADTIHAAKNLARGLVNGLESKVVKTTELNNAINSALLQAKESGEFDGVDGLSAYEIWLSQGNTGSEVDFLESLKGADGASGKDGASGSDGKDGKDGTSVTVQSVTESTADGGENVVTFSDGKTLTVKNGSKGSKGDKGETGAAGYTPQKGTDYWTPTDKAEMTAQVQAVCLAKNQGASNAGKILVVGTDGILTFADMPEGGASGDVVGVLDEANNILLSGNLADGTYTLKYENADGTYTEIGKLEVGAIVPEPTNLFVVGGEGYVLNGRCSSGGADRTDSNGCIVSNYIKVSNGDVVCVNKPFTTTSGAFFGMKLIDGSINGFDPTNTDYISNVSTTNGITQFTVSNANADYIRLCLNINLGVALTNDDVSNANVVITVNEPLS
jgi:hypothetical protein